MEPLQEGLHRARLAIGLRDVLGQRRLGRGAVLLVVHRPARDPDDPSDRGDLAVAVALEQGRQELAVGEVARPAEDDEIEGLDGNDPAAHDASRAAEP